MDKMKERLKRIGGTGHYISDRGNVYDSEGNEVKAFTNPCNYRCVIIDGRIRAVCYMVARAFVEGGDNMLCVVHKDGNRLNDKATNLEWYVEVTTDEDEEAIAVRIEKGNCIKGIYKVDKDNNIVAKFDTLREAKRDARQRNFQHYLEESLLCANGCFYIDKRLYNRHRMRQIIDVNSKRRTIRHTAPSKPFNRVAAYDKTGVCVKVYGSVPQAAQTLGVSKMTIYKYIKDGKGKGLFWKYFCYPYPLEMFGEDKENPSRPSFAKNPKTEK